MTTQETLFLKELVTKMMPIKEFFNLRRTDFAWNRTFTGQVFDCESGLMLYRNRYYHSGLRRFITRDPIGYDAGDENLYRYMGNDTLSFVDPLGYKGLWQRIKDWWNDDGNKVPSQVAPAATAGAMNTTSGPATASGIGRISRGIGTGSVGNATTAIESMNLGVGINIIKGWEDLRQDKLAHVRQDIDGQSPSSQDIESRLDRLEKATDAFIQMVCPP